MPEVIAAMLREHAPTPEGRWHHLTRREHRDGAGAAPVSALEPGRCGAGAAGAACPS